MLSVVLTLTIAFLLRSAALSAEVNRMYILCTRNGIYNYEKCTLVNWHTHFRAVQLAGEPRADQPASGIQGLGRLQGSQAEPSSTAQAHQVDLI